jgi:chromatin remodeling complex protein RSC6
MAEEKGLKKPVKLQAELAAMLGVKELPRTEITQKLWDYIKANQLQTKTLNLSRIVAARSGPNT